MNAKNSEMKRNEMNKAVAVLLDLDETLLFSVEKKQIVGKEKFVEALKSQLDHFDMDDEFVVFLRPGLGEFLDFIGSRYHVGVWTAASKSYAVSIIKFVFEKRSRRLDSFFHSYHCEFAQNKYSSESLKPLRFPINILGINHIILIDDLESNCNQPNAIKIAAFEITLPNDSELLNKTEHEILALVNKFSSDSELDKIKKRIEDECRQFKNNQPISVETPSS